jgi:hypothetical protein
MYSGSSRNVDMTCNKIRHAFRLIDEHGPTMKERKHNWSTLHTLDPCVAQGPIGYTRGSTDPIGGQFRVP